MNRPHVRLRAGITWLQVVNRSGESVGSDGTSHTVTNALDREFLLSARRQADWIVVSADTFVAERYRPSKFAPIAVISSTPSKRDKVEAMIAEVESDTTRHPIEIYESFSGFMAEKALPRNSKILLESGRVMFTALNAAGLVADAYVTVTDPGNNKGEAALKALLKECKLSFEAFINIDCSSDLSFWHAQF